MSNVDVVCTDKTGTLTTGRLSLSDVVPVGPGDAERLVGSLARSTAAPNLTSTALAAALPGEAWVVREEIPFSSSLRWSALRTDDGVVFLGAPDALAPQLSGPPLTATVGERTAQGLRVLVAALPHRLPRRRGVVLRDPGQNAVGQVGGRRVDHQGAAEGDELDLQRVERGRR